MKMTWLKAFLAVVFLICAAATPASDAVAGDFPDKPVTWIVPFKAGGGTDRWARVLSSVSLDVLGQPLRIRNLPGSSAVRGWKYMLEQPADGYTVYQASPTPVIALKREKNPPLKPEQVKIVCFVSAFRNIVLAPPGKPWSTWEGLIKYAKANPGKLTFGATFSELSGTALAFNSAGVKVKLVPYSSTSDAVTDLLGGHIQVAAATESTALTLVPDKAVAILNGTKMPLSEKVSKELGNPPHATALGYKVINFPRWIGVHPDTPDEIVAKLSDKIGEMLKQPSLKKIMGKMGEEIIFVPHKDAQAQYDDIVKGVSEAVAALN
ncbi:MAG: tripartite tricarboxylate transporter substrate binding protein [Hyphomicrobiaceae bacterium]|nr:tripartite tricarboxylate transporter substrate binding protein [Hyphomicrobiaceae bacterium]